MPRPEPIADTFVTVVSPLQDDADIAAEFVRDVTGLLRQRYANYELILVDNGSNDQTVQNVQSLLKDIACIRLIRLSRRHDRETAIFAGLEAAIGDFVAVLIPGSDQPKLIGQLVEKLRGGRDIVFGQSSTNRIHSSPLAKLSRRIFYWYSKRFLNIDLPGNATYLLGLNRRAVNALTQTKGRYRHVRQLSRQVGFATDTLSYEPLPEAAGRTKRGVFGSVSLAMEIAVSYSRHPLRFVSWLGLAAGALNLLYGVYALGIFLFKTDVVEGWTTLSLLMTTMFFFVFVILVVISEYVGRILEETRQQPAYHVMEELTSNEEIADATRRNIAR